MSDIRENDVVALLVDRPEVGFKRGDVGTVIEVFKPNTKHPGGVIVEFVDELGNVQGQTDITDLNQIIKLRPKFDFDVPRLRNRETEADNNPLIVEMTGIFGAGYLPGLFKPVTLTLRSNYCRVTETASRDLVTMYHVDNTAVQETDPERRARISQLIRQSPNLNNKQWEELIASLQWSDDLFRKHIASHTEKLQRKIDVVFRRGGKLQNYILLGGTRWEEAEINRMAPKLQYFLWADLKTIKESFEYDEDIRRELLRDPASYNATPEQAYESQQEWLRKVERFTGLKVIERQTPSKEKFAQDIIAAEIVKGLEYYGLEIKPKQKVFISYSTQDQSFADLLCSNLQEKGIPCWFASRDIQGGRKLDEQIDKAIQDYDKVLIVLSEHSMRSPWVLREISKAVKQERQERRRKLFPIRLVSMNEISGWQSFHNDLIKDLGEEIREYFIPDFSDWRHSDSFAAALNKLVNDLRKARD